MDAKHDELLITFDLPHPLPPTKAEKLSSPSSKRHRKHHHHPQQKPHAAEPISLEIKLAQDQSALRSKKGDTGKLVPSPLNVSYDCG